MGMFHVASYSGGKDSTAMLIVCKKQGINFDDIVYVDVGDWMWDFVKDHIKKMEDFLNQDITVIDVSDEIKDGFERWGFPSFRIRWCTGIKREHIKEYISTNYGIDNTIQYIGYTYGEEKRINKNKGKGLFYYPLMKHKIDNDTALKICYDNGFDFNGLYEHHSHLNCWCCPLQRVDELRYIYNNCPDKWEILKKMQDKVDGYFSNNKTIYEFDKRFKSELDVK